MALISPQQTSIQGDEVTFAAANAGGDTLAPSTRGVLLVRNDDTVSHTATIVVPGNTKFAEPQPDVDVVVADATIASIGPFPRDLGDPADNLVDITYDAVTSVTVAYVLV